MPISLDEPGIDAEVTLESETGREVNTRPFYILVMGGFSGDAQKKPLSQRSLSEIDRDNFEEIIGRLGTCIDLEFPGQAAFKLEIRSLDDFSPDEIYRKIGLFEKLRQLRNDLANPQTYNQAARFAKELFGIEHSREDNAESQAENSEISYVQDEGGLLGAILSNPEGGSKLPRQRPKGELGQLVSDLVRPYLVQFDENEQEALIAAADASATVLMRAILKSEAFRKLESAWRALYFLVRRAETDSNLKIFILDISKNELLDSLKENDDLTQTTIFKLLTKKVGTNPDYFSLLVSDFSFEPTVEDIAALLRLGKISDALKSPFLSAMSPKVLGFTGFDDSPDQRNWQIDPDSKEGKLWTALRESDVSSSIGMTIPRFLLRLPWGKSAEPTEYFDFEEFEKVPAHEDFLWGNGAYLAAVLLAEGFSALGDEMGSRLPQDVFNLPIYTYNELYETKVKPCAEIEMTEIGVERLLSAGFIPLISFRGDGRIKIGKFQSIAAHSKPLKSRWAQ